MIKAKWPAPTNIQALSTTRDGGVSLGHYTGLNLAAHVGDDPQAVMTNRQILRQTLNLPSEPLWLNQTHSTRCVVVDQNNPDREADAAITRNPNTVLAILTGDCLPIMICNQQGTEIGAIHAGWRGLASGIIAETLASMQSNPQQLLAWMGPAICGRCYATGAEVLDTFASHYSFAHHAFWQQGSQWYADLPKMAGLIFAEAGVSNVYYSSACTLESHSQFYSYRREPQTGRIATLIWFQESL